MPIATRCSQSDIHPSLPARPYCSPARALMSGPDQPQPRAARASLPWSQPSATEGAALPCPHGSAGIPEPASMALTSLRSSPTASVSMAPSEAQQAVADYVCLAALAHARRLRRDRNHGAMPPPSVLRVGIVGDQELAQPAEAALLALGFAVQGWHPGPSKHDPVREHQYTMALSALAAAADILVCLLPARPATPGILNLALFRALPRGSLLIHVAHQSTLVARDLLMALEEGCLCRAIVDIWSEEVSPPGPSLRQHPRITLTPRLTQMIAANPPAPHCNRLRL